MSGQQTSGSAALPVCQPLAADPQWERARQDLIKPFVIASHSDLDAVVAGLADEPQLVNARLYEFDEAPIEAAAHMGRADITHCLLGSGAPLTVHAAAMLGLTGTVEAYLRRDPGLAKLRGAHGIAMMFHAALSGQVAVAELLVQCGGGQDYGEALHAAVARGHVDMTRWLLERGAGLAELDFQKRTPLARAIELGHTEIAGLLSGAGATA